MHRWGHGIPFVRPPKAGNRWIDTLALASSAADSGQRNDRSARIAIRATSLLSCTWSLCTILMHSWAIGLMEPSPLRLIHFVRNSTWKSFRIEGKHYYCPVDRLEIGDPISEHGFNDPVWLSVSRGTDRATHHPIDGWKHNHTHQASKLAKRVSDRIGVSAWMDGCSITTAT